MREQRQAIQAKEAANVAKAAAAERRRVLAMERKRRQRERERSDPVNYAEVKKKENARHHQRVESGKIKTANEMTVSELKGRRKQWRKHSATYRTKKKEDSQNNPPPISIKEKGRRKVKANRAKVVRELEKSEERVEALQKKNDRLRKRLEKLSKAKENSPAKPTDTPNTKVRKLLHDENVGEQVRKQLVFGAVLEEKVRKATRFKAPAIEKRVVSKLLASSQERHDKQKCKKKLQSLGAAKLQEKFSNNPDLTVNFKRKTSTVRNNSVNDVIQFYLRDDVSALCPDKKGYVLNFKNGKQKKRKRYLRGPLTELYKQYCASVPNPVSYTTFTRLKPFYCVNQKTNERNTCLCTTCENMKLLTSALHRSKILDYSSATSLMMSICCDPRTDSCMTRACDHCREKAIDFKPFIDTEIIDYREWQNLQNTVQNQDGSIVKKTPKWKKMDCADEAANVVSMFKTKFEKFMAHTHRDSHQQSHFRDIRKSLGPGDLYLHFDWSQNYVLKCNREIQSAFYGATNEEISLYTGRAYLANAQLGFCTISDNTEHTAAYVIAHLVPVLQMLFTEYTGVTRLYLQSDSSTSQYRNKDMFFLVTQYLTKLFPAITQIVYGFSEGGYSKGEADGVGGWCKNALEAEVNFGVDIGNAEQAVAVLKKRSKKTKIIFIDKDAHHTVERALPKPVPAFEGTASVHAYSWTKEKSNEVYFGTMSCSECAPGSQCIHFGLPHSPLKYKAAAVVDSSTDTTTSERTVETSNPPATKKKLEVDGWVVVSYGNIWYPGVIEKVTSKSVVVNFMVRHQTKDHLFLWPPKQDKLQVKRTDILYVMNQPPAPKGRELFLVPEKEYIDKIMTENDND